MKNTPKAKEPSAKEYEKLGRALGDVYEYAYANRRRAYRMAFTKGIFSGLGGVLGATVLVALLLWLLSLFDTVPLIGGLIDAVRQTIDSR